MNTKQLRQKILDMAIKGKLVPQDPNDEPACKLLERIREEKEQLIKEGKLKRDKNESYIFVGADKLHYEKFADGSVVCIEDEIPFEIPESWEWCRLSEICIKLVDGAHNPPKGEDNKTDYIMASSTNINNDTLVELEKVRYLSKENFISENARTNLKIGDILLTTVGTLGRSCVYDNDLNLCFQRSVTVITTLLFNHYLKNFFDSNFFQEIMIKEGTGTAQKGFYLNQLSNVLIPVPPIDEQKRISEYIYQLSALIKNVDNNKIILYNLIKQTKAKILDLAIKGKLVPQDPNDEPADKLLEKIREEKERLIKEGKLKRDKNETYIFKNSDDNSYYEQIDGETVCIDDDLPFEIPQSWRWCKVDNVTTIKGGKRLPSGQSLLNDKTNHPYLRIVDMKNNTIIDDDIHYISEDVFAKIKQYIITDEDLYITIAGTIGNVGIIPSKYNNANLTENAVRVTPLLINKKYLMYSILSNYVQNQFIDKTHHVAMPKLAIERIKGVFVPIPPLFEQSNIINKLESIFSYLDNLELMIKGS